MPGNFFVAGHGFFLTFQYEKSDLSTHFGKKTAKFRFFLGPRYLHPAPVGYYSTIELDKWTTLGRYFIIPIIEGGKNLL
jgi:hypothetical protein